MKKLQLQKLKKKRQKPNLAILGIDEVGRGPWAGPLVVGACVLGDAQIEGLTDSKKLTPKKREALAPIIREQAAVGLGWISAEELDRIGLSQALCKAARAAVKQIKVPFHEIIIDGTVNFLRDTPLASHVQVLKKADLLVPEVSAASIVAKVARDEYMYQLAKKYPGYGFEKHVGYGTAAHKAALEKLTTDLDLSQIAGITANNGNQLVFHFLDGHECTRRWEDRSRSESWTAEMKEYARLNAKKNQEANEYGNS